MSNEFEISSTPDTTMTTAETTTTGTLVVRRRRRRRSPDVVAAERAARTIRRVLRESLRAGRTQFVLEIADFVYERGSAGSP
jgi:ribosomal protein L31E